MEKAKHKLNNTAGITINALQRFCKNQSSPSGKPSGKNKIKIQLIRLFT